MDVYEKELYAHFNVDEKLLREAENIEKELLDIFQKIDRTAHFNQLKVLKAMQESRLSDTHFNSSSGYGYGDAGREKVEEIFARLFKAEDALVRPTIVNGTHALTLALQGLLMPGDRMLSITGKPYDTLEEVIGIRPHPLSLQNYGIQYQQIDLLENGSFDTKALKKVFHHLSPSFPKMVYIQRSKGYSERPSISVSDIQEVAALIHTQSPTTILMVDNCYGEFIEREEPIEAGADIIAGSLIKNPGGGLALTGGYVAGRRDLVDLAAKRLTSPGIGKECGLTFGTNRMTLQGLFLAPTVVACALKGAIFCAALFERSGQQVFPHPYENRSDIIQAVRFDHPKEVIAFCQAIQKAAPVDSYVVPEPWSMPGYEDPVIMAAGAFIQGSSIELSADAPMRPPYTVYFQGGLTYPHARLGSLMAFQAIEDLKK